MEIFLVLATYSPNYFAKQMFPLQYECGNYLGASEYLYFHSEPCIQ